MIFHPRPAMNGREARVKEQELLFIPERVDFYSYFYGHLASDTITFFIIPFLRLSARTTIASSSEKAARLFVGKATVKS